MKKIPILVYFLLSFSLPGVLLTQTLDSTVYKKLDSIYSAGVEATIQGELKFADKYLKEIKSFSERHDTSFLGVWYFFNSRLNQLNHKYQEALTEIEKAIPLLEKDTMLSRYLMFATNNGAMLYQNLGKSQKALEYFSKNLKMFEKSHGSNSLEYATALENLGVCYMDTSDPYTSEQHILQCMEIRKNILGPNDLQIARCHINLSVVYDALDQIPKAISNLETAYDIYLNAGVEQPVYPTTICLNLGTQYFSMHHFQKALEYFTIAEKEAIKLGGPMNPYCVEIYFNLSDYYGFFNEYELSNEYGLKALELSKLFYGKESSKYALTLQRHAINLNNLNIYDQVISTVGEADSILVEIYGKENSYVAQSKMILAGLSKDQGNLKEAIKYAKSGLKISEQSWSHKSIQPTKDAFILGEYYFLNKDFDAAAEILIAYGDHVIQYFEDNAKYFTSSDLFHFTDFVDTAFNLVASISMEVKSPELSDLLLKWIWFRNGYILSRNVAYNQIDGISQQESEVYKQWKSIQKKIGKEINKNLADQGSIDSLKMEEKKIESSLLLELPEILSSNVNEDFTSFQKDLSNLNNVCHLFSYRNPGLDTISIFGVLVSNRSKLNLIELGELRDLSDMLINKDNMPLKEFINSIYQDESDFKKLFQSKVLSTLSKVIAENEDIYIAPTGFFHRVNIVGIFEEYFEQTSHLFNNFKMLFQSDFTQNSVEQASIFANLNYGDTLSWPQLAFTKNEGDAIYSIMDDKGIDVNYFQGFAGTKDKLESKESQQDGIIHFATHGYFIDDQVNIRPTENNTRGSGILNLSDPLNRSGLVLSSSEDKLQKFESSSSQNDLLTAFEISQLNLNRTQLVVLSACESGLGFYDDHEGVFGLQRAFTIAGVDNMIMSLWKVSDFHTMEFMKEFYQRFIKDKEELSTAFFNTKQSMKAKYTEPYFYAGFVLLENHVKRIRKFKSNYLIFIGLSILIFALFWLAFRKNSNLTRDAAN